MFSSDNSLTVDASLLLQVTAQHWSFKDFAYCAELFTFNCFTTNIYMFSKVAFTGLFYNEVGTIILATGKEETKY